mgnify:FL=1|tara:strand:- start:124 stop:876 length:753 start_codon:yes stop_codon:yes gene_type:complete
MKKLLLLLLIPFFAFSQTNPDREYWQTNKWTPKKGMNAEFEAGVAKKTNKFNGTAETSMATYQIITGQDQGKYMRVMGNRDSSAFDEDNTAELEYWNKHVMPYVESNDGNIRWWRMKGLSQNWDNDLPPARFVKMTRFTIKPDKRTDFFSFWRNNTKLQKELGYSGITGLFMLVTGGESYEILRVEPYNSHAEGMGEMTNPDVDYVEEYNKMFGWRTHSNDLAAFQSSIEKWGIKIETAELNTEMSSKLK